MLSAEQAECQLETDCNQLVAWRLGRGLCDNCRADPVTESSRRQPRPLVSSGEIPSPPGPLPGRGPEKPRPNRLNSLVATLFRCLLAGLLAFAGFAPAFALTVPDGLQVEAPACLEDATGTATLAEVVARAGDFSPLPTDVADYRFSSSAYWFHLRVANRRDLPATYYLDIRHATLDHLDLHVLRADGRVETLATGDRVPSLAKPFPSATPALPFRLAAGESADLYLRAHTEGGSMLVPLAVSDQEGMERSLADERTWHGLLLGLYALLFVFNVLVFLMFRERSSLYFAVFLPFAFLSSASLSGFVPTAFFADGTWMANEGLVFSTGMAFLANLMFSREFLRLGDLGRRRPLFATLVAVGLFMVASPFLLPIRWAFAAGALILILTPAMPVAVGADVWRGGRTDARFYVAGQSLGWAGLLGFGLAVYGVVPFKPLFIEGVAIGIGLGALLLAVALMERVRDLARAKAVAERAAAAALLHRKEELERLVTERTAELDKARIAAEALATTDVLTGIHNRRGVLDLAERALKLARRSGRPLALAIFDLDHFKDINDRHGHPEGDRVLREVARTVAATVRTTDLFGRLGGEEFLLVLPDTSPPEAFLLCERVREALAGRVSAGAPPEPVTASFGVVCTDAHSGDLGLLQSAADRALYAAKNSGRNRVVAAETMARKGGQRARS